MASLLRTSLKKCLSCRCGGVQAASPPPDQQHAVSVANDLREISLEDLDILVDYVTSKVKHFDPNSASASHQINSTMLSQISQWQERKGELSSFMQYLPENLRREVIGAGENLIIPLLSRAFGGIGALHWLGLGFSFIGWSLENIDKTAQYWQDCLELLKRIVCLLENTRKVWKAGEKDPIANFDDSLKDTIVKAFHCAIICTSNLSDHYILRFLKAASAKDAITSLKEKLDTAIQQNMENVNAAIYVSLVCPIEEQVKFPPATVPGGAQVMQRAMDYLKTDCNDIMAVCLHGMGGIGKSTLGDSIFAEFQNLATRVYSCCRVVLPFEIKDEDLHKWQNEILHKLCYRKDEVSNSTDGKERLKQELSKIKQPIFLYIDNVLKKQHLRRLLPSSSCFPDGSRILITTRHEFIRDCVKNDLNIGNCELIEVRKLKKDLAKKILWQTIRGQKKQVGSYIEDLEKRVLELCDGLPLALEVVGSYIRSEYEHGPMQDTEIWSNVVKAMESAKPLHGDTEDELYHRLMFSIKCLDEGFRSAFLDIVTFSVGSSWELSKLAVGNMHLEELRRRALVQKTNTEYKFAIEILDQQAHILEVHDVLKEMGMRMVANDKNDIRITSQANLMENSDSLANVVGLVDVTVKAQQLKQMPRLRFLVNVRIEGECEEAKLRHLMIVLNMTSETSRPFSFSECTSLKVLRWRSNANDAPNLEVLTHCRGLEHLSLAKGWEQLENVDVIQSLRCLTDLFLEDCPNIRSLPDGIANLTGLRVLILMNCTRLESLPEAISSLTTNLKALGVCRCNRIRSLPDGIAHLTGLRALNLDGCKRLESLPDIGSLTGLKRLYLSGCESLESLPDIGSLTGLTRLDLSGCESLESLPEGISNVTGLIELRLNDCKCLKSLPEGVSNLTRLRELSLSNCKRLLSTPDIGSLTGLTGVHNFRGCESLQSVPGIGSLTGLTCLDFSGCKSLQSIPDIGSLTGLSSLLLRGCERLQSIPGIGSMTGLRILNFRGCKSLQSIPDIGSLTELMALHFRGCERLQSIPDIGSLTGLIWLTFSGCRILESLPDIGSLTRLTELDLSGCESQVPTRYRKLDSIDRA